MLLTSDLTQLDFTTTDEVVGRTIVFVIELNLDVVESVTLSLEKFPSFVLKSLTIFPIHEAFVLPSRFLPRAIVRSGLFTYPIDCHSAIRILFAKRVVIL